MKNLLIPTTLDLDTINAVKTAIKQSKGEHCTIILLQVSEVLETESSAFFLRNLKSEMTVSQQQILKSCRILASNSSNCALKICNQYGISSPILKNLMEHHHIGLTILAPSYKTAQKKIHKLFLQILLNGKCPILHLSDHFEEHDLNTALYLEKTKSRLQAEDLQSLMQGQFDFRIVSQAKVFEDQKLEEITPLITEAISKNKINLLIETRKPEKIKFKRSTESSVNETLGLPVLSLYEEMV
ncbi:hypothetical protein [Flavobacterium sp. '19STA2R22 D10 B1']|uniref:hypothetical protein n=1 Tax=Flavobacterium aerium TaxID=3037261 RepID=UPI00278C1E81|nr:hypothetical protein [Flavobacterium sp. '19STA2R22 D10 B1']